MNKTIIININGTVFHIEEDAYEILKNYMTEVKRHFSNSADSLEITTDIENRIAEMFSEQLAKDNKQVIVEQDVKLVIEQMGSVADFENAEHDDKANTDSFTYTGNTEGRRLFRDPDDHLIGGVCAGIANYFDIDVVWIRLIFALLSPAAGGGLFLYLILWLVVPKAVTRADKMAMKGEKQNLQGFKKNFEEELSSVKQNLSNFGNETRPFVYKARDFAGGFFHHLGIFLAATGRVLVKMIGAFILVVCFGFAIALVVALVAFIGFNANPHPFFPFTIIGNEHADNVYICVFFTAFIPLLSIILVTLKGIFNVGAIGKSTGTVFLIIWICSLSMLIYYAVKISSNFRESATFTKTINLKPAKNGAYYLNLNNIKYFSHDDSVRLDIKDHFRNMVVIDDRYNHFNNDEPRTVSITIEKSDVNYPVLVETYSAKGSNYDDALSNALTTSYVFAQQDSVLKFDYSLRKRPNISWHDEGIELTLKLPMSAKVVIDQKLDNYLRDVNLYDCNQANKKHNPNTTTFIMTDNGLQCNVDTVVTAKKDSTGTK